MATKREVACLRAGAHTSAIRQLLYLIRNELEAIGPAYTPPEVDQLEQAALNLDDTLKVMWGRS